LKVVSVNVGQPRPILLRGRVVLTGIYKVPVPGRIPVRRHNLDGDAQADLRVHGGEFKAVYAYPFEHYAYWEAVLERPIQTPGMFGENLTVTGLLEDAVFVGDVFRVGSAMLQVTQPRIPCSKLAAKFKRPQFIKEFLRSGRSGFYLRVLEEGEVETNNSIERIRRDANHVTVRQLLGLTDLGEVDKEVATRALGIDSLPSNSRESIAKLL
jgi:MOSC domain-containing protein YiiM